MSTQDNLASQEKSVVNGRNSLCGHRKVDLCVLKEIGVLTQHYLTSQFGTQVKFRWSCDRNDRTAENAFSAPWFFSEMQLEPAAG